MSTNADQQVEIPGQMSIVGIEVLGQMSIADIEFLAEPTAHARHTDPDTSQAAADALSPDTIRKSQQIVLDELGAWGSMTDTELVARLAGRLSPSGTRTRRRELADLGIVIDSGERVTLRSGRKAIVWSVAI